jgi:RHS repeat-associated protein
MDAVAPTIITYDVIDRSIQTILPDGATTTVEFGILPDNIGNPMRSSTTIDALGNITAKYQDVRERMRSEMAAGPNGEIWTNYHYNAISELIRIEDTENNATVYTYDQLGRRTVINHPDAGVTSFEFDLTGNLLRKITDKIRLEIAPTGAVEYTYDYERLIKIEYPKNFQNTVQLHYGVPGAEFNRAGRLWLREDASGGEEFFYGPQGETIKSIRTLLISQSNVHTYVTEYLFDTWGRIQELRYPDGEVVSYDYNSAGKLSSIVGRKSGIDYDYIKEIGYDKFEEKAFLHFGNGVQTTYVFAPDRRWLQQTKVSMVGGSAIIDNTYGYDAISNLLSLNNNAPGTPGKPGGTSSHSYTYDELYRLITGIGTWSGTDGQQRTYALNMRYDDLHNILAKEQIVEVDGIRDPLKTYQFDYAYEGATPHAPSEVAGRRMLYDASGNLVATRGETAFTFSQLLWDEENRLRGVSNNGYISQYTYDALGERAIKSHGGQQGVFVDGAPAGAIDHLDRYTAYVNPYFSVENDRFTKHYFAGEMKVLSKIGTGKFHFSPLPGLQNFTAGDLNYSRRMQLLSQAQDSWYTALGVPPGPPTLQGYYGQPEYTGIPLSQGSTGSYNNPPAHWPGPPGPPDPNGPPGPPVWYAQPLTRDHVHAGYGFDSTATEIFKETDAFFYHQDHVGSTHYLTDWIGEVRQHTEYIPFGEVFVDQHTSSDAHPYKFNGKELDEETGYYYFGARYYDPRLSLWNSVDPLAGKFPAWSPYAFTFHNPVRYNDPDGREPDAVINAISGLGYVKVARDYFEGFTQSTSYSFDNKPDRVFWSGGSVAMNTAKQFAAAHNAISLEMTQEGQRLEKITNTLSELGKQEGQSGYFGFLSTENFWKQISKGFAAGATGEVTAVLRKSAMRKDNIYEKDERPILQKNLLKFKGMTLKEKTIETEADGNK